MTREQFGERVSKSKKQKEKRKEKIEKKKKKKSIGHRAENRELFKMQPRSISWMESGSQR